MSNAADLLFDLEMAPAGRFDRVKRRPVGGEDPLDAWPPCFRAAFVPNPVLGRINEMQFVPVLKFARDRYAGGSGDRTSPTETDEIPSQGSQI